MNRHSTWFSLITAAWLAGAGTASAQEADFPAGVHRVECPLVLLSSGNLPGLPAVEGVIGDRPVLFLVDTGANTCGIDEAIIETLELRRTGTDYLSGVGGLQKVSTYRISGLRFGEMEVSGMRCMGKDVRKFSAGRDDAILGGVLGNPFFSRVPTTIDYPARKIVFWDPEEFEPPDAPATPITSMLGIPVARAKIGDRNVQLVVDTGAEPALILYPAFVERHMVLDSGEGQPSMTMRGWTGSSTSRFARVSEVELGDVVLHDVTASLLLESTRFGLGSDRLRAGLIGTALLSSFVVTLDYRHRRVFLQAPAKVATSHPTGIYFRRVDGAVLVAGTVDGTPAAEHLRDDDTIENIESRPPPATMFEVYQLLRSKPELRLQIERDGESLELTLPRWDSTPKAVFAPKKR